MAWPRNTLVERARLIHEIAGPDCSTLLNLKAVMLVTHSKLDNS